MSSDYPNNFNYNDDDVNQLLQEFYNNDIGNDTEKENNTQKDNETETSVRKKEKYSKKRDKIPVNPMKRNMSKRMSSNAVSELKKDEILNNDVSVTEKDVFSKNVQNENTFGEKTTNLNFNDDEIIEMMEQFKKETQVLEILSNEKKDESPMDNNSNTLTKSNEQTVNNKVEVTIRPEIVDIHGNPIESEDISFSTSENASQVTKEDNISTTVPMNKITPEEVQMEIMNLSCNEQQFMDMPRHPVMEYEPSPQNTNNSQLISNAQDVDNIPEYVQAMEDMQAIVKETSTEVQATTYDDATDLLKEKLKEIEKKEFKYDDIDDTIPDFADKPVGDAEIAARLEKARGYMKNFVIMDNNVKVPFYNCMALFQKMYTSNLNNNDTITLTTNAQGILDKNVRSVENAKLIDLLEPLIGPRPTDMSSSYSLPGMVSIGDVIKVGNVSYNDSKLFYCLLNSSTALTRNSFISYVRTASTIEDGHRFLYRLRKYTDRPYLRTILWSYGFDDVTVDLFCFVLENIPILKFNKKYVIQTSRYVILDAYSLVLNIKNFFKTHSDILHYNMVNNFEDYQTIRRNYELPDIAINTIIGHVNDSKTFAFAFWVYCSRYLALKYIDKTWFRELVPDGISTHIDSNLKCMCFYQISPTVDRISSGNIYTIDSDTDLIIVEDCGKTCPILRGDLKYYMELASDHNKEAISAYCAKLSKYIGSDITLTYLYPLLFASQLNCKEIVSSFIENLEKSSSEKRLTKPEIMLMAMYYLPKFTKGPAFKRNICTTVKTKPLDKIMMYATKGREEVKTEIPSGRAHVPKTSNMSKNSSTSVGIKMDLEKEPSEHIKLSSGKHYTMKKTASTTPTAVITKEEKKNTEKLKGQQYRIGVRNMVRNTILKKYITYQVAPNPVSIQKKTVDTDSITDLEADYIRYLSLLTKDNLLPKDQLESIKNRYYYTKRPNIMKTIGKSGINKILRSIVNELKQIYEANALQENRKNGNVKK